jgi:hypothetical protein
VAFQTNGQSVAPIDLVVEPRSRSTVHVNDVVPPGLDVSMAVSSPGVIVAERPLYFRTDLAGGADGATTVAGATSAATTFYFAEGTVRPGYVEYLTLQNPGDGPATAHLAFQTSGAVAAPLDVAVPPHSRVTVPVADHIAGPTDVAVTVTSDQPLVAERPLYFHTDQADGGTDVVGAIAPATTFSFAEGTTRPGFVEYLTLQNPGTALAGVRIEFQSAGGAAVPGVTVPVAAQARTTIRVNDLVPPGTDLGVTVAADQPIVAERAMYFDALGVNGGTALVGVTAAGSQFRFAEGTTRPGFTEFLTLENPGDRSSVAHIEFQPASAGLALAPLDETVAPHSRVTVVVNDHVPPGTDVSMSVTSDQPLVAERPMYFTTDLAGGANGGTVAAGA